MQIHAEQTNDRRVAVQCTLGIRANDDLLRLLPLPTQHFNHQQPNLCHREVIKNNLAAYDRNSKVVDWRPIYLDQHWRRIGNCHLARRADQNTVVKAFKSNLIYLPCASDIHLVEGEIGVI